MKNLLLLLVWLPLFSAMPQGNNGSLSSVTSSTNISEVSMKEADTTKVYQLPEIVVTATRLEKNSSEVGRSVTVVSRDQINASVFNSMAEVLSQYQGTYIVGTGQNPGMLQSIFLRGAASNHTTIMIDNIRITDPSAVNNALDISELSFGGLERVEIVRGSHSTLYGSSAIGGVVNIITGKNRLPGFHADAELKTGTFGEATSLFSQKLFLNYSDPIGLYVNAGVENSNIRGLDATVDTITNQNTYNNRDRDGFAKRNLFGKVGLKKGALDLYVSYANTDHKVDFDKGAYRDDDNSTLNFKRNLFTYGASYDISERFGITYVGGYSDMKRAAVDDSSVVDRAGNTDQTYSDGTWNGTMATNEFQGSLRLPRVEGVFGMGSYRETMTSKTYFYSRSSFGVFEFSTNLDTLHLQSTTSNVFAHVDVDGSILGKDVSWLKLAFGARFNKHSVYGSNPTYEISPSFKLADRTLMYLAYTTGFNAPSLYQLYAPNKDFTSGITRGNKALEPERSASYEIGVKHSAGDDLQLSASYFHTVVDHSIEYVYLWDKNIEIKSLGDDWRRNDFRGDTYLNLGKQTNDGIEVSFHAKLSGRWMLAGNVSLVSGTWSYRPTEINKAQTAGNHVQVFNNGAFINKEVETLGLVRRPHTANINLRYQASENFLLRLNARMVSARNDIYYDSDLGPYGALGMVPVAQYTLVDFSQRWNLHRSFTINGKIENLFDTKYYEINGFTTRGRGFYISLRYGFNQ